MDLRRVRLRLSERLATEYQAIGYVERVRWPDGGSCPYCGATHVSRRTSSDRPQARWQCYECRRSFSVRVGTVMHRSHLEVRTWLNLTALYRDPTSNGNVSEVSRLLELRRSTVSSVFGRLQDADETSPELNALLDECISTQAIETVL